MTFSFLIYTHCSHSWGARRHFTLAFETSFTDLSSIVLFKIQAVTLSVLVVEGG